jgi:hypothetical protein
MHVALCCVYPGNPHFLFDNPDPPIVLNYFPVGSPANIDGLSRVSSLFFTTKIKTKPMIQKQNLYNPFSSSFKV